MVYFGGNKVYSRGFSKILGLWESLFFVARGFGDSVDLGDYVGVFEKREHLVAYGLSP